MPRPPVPPRVSQLQATLPDGRIDLASTTDCGETVAVAALAAYGGLRISPGCARQALELSPDNGSTEASDLSRFFDGVGLSSQRHAYSAGRHKSLLRRFSRRGHLAAVLGFWQGRSELHWVLAYGYHPQRGWYMDPWVGDYVSFDWSQASALTVGVAVEVWT